MSDNQNLILEVSRLTKKTPAGLALDNVSFALEKGHRLAIAGETGAGKSTLLKIIGGIVQADPGTAIFEGKRLKGPDDQLIPGNKGVAYLSQQYELRNNYRVWELLEIANKIDAAEADEIYKLCRIDYLINRMTSQLSGGERQRISLAMLLITKPRLLVLDEPFSNLDPIHTRLLKSVLKEVSERLQLTCLLASHEPQDTLAWADEMIVLKDGAIVQQGTPVALYRQPVSEYVAGLLGPYQLLSGDDAAALGLNVTAFPADKKLLVRPEHFSLTQHSDCTFSGIISDRHFMGSHYEAAVQVQELKINILSNDGVLADGDTACVIYKVNSAWYV